MNDHLLRRDLAKAAMRRGAELDWHRIAERVLELASVPDGVLHSRSAANHVFYSQPACRGPKLGSATRCPVVTVDSPVISDSAQRTVDQTA